MIKYVDKTNRFMEIFNPDTGFYMRSGIIDENGKETEQDPFMRTFPNLLDIGIMGNCKAKHICKKGGIDCYQNGFIKEEDNMSLSMLENIINQSKGKVFSIAFGGRGDPNSYEHFSELLKLCKSNNISSTYTTSGIGLTDEQVALTKQYCGAVAVSWQRQQHTIKALNKFIEAGCTTNIHYVLSNKNIDELIDLIKKDKFPSRINALIILNYKNIGQGGIENVIKGNEPKLKELFQLIDNTTLKYKIGFDSCSCQYVSKLMGKVDSKSVASCDSSRFSAYINPRGIMSPCSFDCSQSYGVDLNKFTMEEAWNSLQFELFRDKQRFGLESGKCQTCKYHNDTCTHCVLVPDINSCNNI
jgi:radical SAM protein with 4Fe4S-binding SPASM domain